MYGELITDNRANFRLPVFGGFTRSAIWRIKKKKPTKLAWYPGAR